MTANNPSSLWIGEIINSGERTYSEWSRKQQSLSYIFKEQITRLFEEYELDDLFDCTEVHPPILKEYLGEHIDLETVVILEKVFKFRSRFNRKT